MNRLLQIALRSKSSLASGPVRQSCLYRVQHFASYPDPLPPMVSSAKMKQYKAEESKYNGKLVYVGSLTRQLKSAKIISLSSSILGLATLPLLVDNLSTSGLAAQIMVYGTASFFIFVTPLISVLFTKRYVSRMYYNYDEQVFKAVLFNFFLLEYSIDIKLKDLYVPEMPGAFSTLKTKSTNKSLFVNLDHVTDVQLVEKILGYDQPFDVNNLKIKKKSD